MPDIQNFSHVTYTGDGSTQIFNIPFEFIKREYVYATIDGVDMDMTTVEWLTDSTIRFAEAPANDSVVVIYRDTDKSEPLVDFADGSVLSEKDLDEEVRQLLHIAQEVYDVPGRMQETIDKMNEQYEYVHNVAEEVTEDVRESTESIKDAAIEAVNQTKDEVIEAVNQTKDEVIETVNETKDTVISTVNETKDTAISTINVAVESQINRATAEANRAEEAASRVEAVSDLGPATADKLGLVKPGGNMTVDADGSLNVNLPEPPDPYTLPKASADVLGGVKVGDGLEIDEDGKLKAKAQEINIGPDMMKDEATNTISDKREVLYFEEMPEEGLPVTGVKNGAVAIIDDGNAGLPSGGVGLPELTEEHIIGYLKGKPVYRRVFECISASAINTQAPVTPEILLEGKKLISAYGVLHTPSGSDNVCCSFTQSGNTTYWIWIGKGSDGKLQEKHNYASYNSCPMTITAIYTKTTD